MIDLILYLSPFLPLLTRISLIVKFWVIMRTNLSKEERDESGHFIYIFPLAGFIFTGLLALIVLEITNNIGLSFPIYFLFIGFIGYMSAINLQGYKFGIWQDQIATGMMEMGSLSLILSILNVLLLTNFHLIFILTLSLIAVSVWLIDHIVRIRYSTIYLSKLIKLGEAIMNRDDKEEKKRTTKGISWAKCPIHNTPYPSGAECPDCRTERLEKSEKGEH